MLLMYEKAREVLASRVRESVDYKLENVEDALAFGFSYMEAQDHLVEIVVASPMMMKRILAESDAELYPAEDSIGSIRTAKLLVSSKLNDRQIVFANSTISAVIDIDMHNKWEEDDGYV